MDQPMLTLAEQSRSKLRVAMAALEANLSELDGLPTGADVSRTTGQLRDSWQEIVLLLAVEPEPERRSCPSCKGPMMLLATRCIHCWKKSAPPKADRE
jgi:hypothetical protein